MPTSPAARIEAARAALARTADDLLEAVLDHPLPPAAAVSILESVAILHSALQLSGPHVHAALSPAAAALPEARVLLLADLDQERDSGL